MAGKPFTNVNYRRWMSFEAAKMTVRSLNIKSRQEYINWHQATKPIGIPAKPARVYKWDWKGWGDFIGTYNQWVPGYKYGSINWRTHAEALKFAQKLGIKVVADWHDAYNKGKIPKDIPKHPDLYYKEKGWINWPVFLGFSVQDKLVGAKINTSILAICIPAGYPGGFILPVIAKDGEQDMKEQLTALNNPRVVKAYQWEQDKTAWFKNLLKSSGTEQSNDMWLIGNINYVIGELDQVLSWYVAKKR